jgi:hypothetical protein
VSEILDFYIIQDNRWKIRYLKREFGWKIGNVNRQKIIKYRINFNKNVKVINKKYSIQEKEYNYIDDYYYDCLNQHNFIILGYYKINKNKFKKGVVYDYKLISLVKREINEEVIRL